MHESREDHLGGFWVGGTMMEDVNLDLNISYEIIGLCILGLAYLSLFQQDQILPNIVSRGIQSFM